GSAQAFASAATHAVAATLQAVSAGRWGAAAAHLLHQATHGSTASTRAVAARALVLPTFAQQTLHLQTQSVPSLKPPSRHCATRTPTGSGYNRLRVLAPRGGDDSCRARRGDALQLCGGGGGLCRPGLAHPPERRVRRPEAPLQTQARRPALYLAAFVAARCAPQWRVRYQRLLDRGRAKKEAFTILARALLRVMYHLLRTGEPYDPALLNPSSPATTG